MNEIGVERIIKETEYIQSPSGLIMPSFYVAKPKRPTHFDFFCGAGGFGLGMVQAGCETVGANEWDAYAAITYMVNLGHYPMSIHFLDGEEDRKRLDKAIAKNYGIKNYKYEEGITVDNFQQLIKRQEEEYDIAQTAGAEEECLRDYHGTEDILIHKHCAGSGWISSRPEIGGCKNFWFGDVHKLTGKMVLDTLGMKQGDIDVVTGGPPCQGFSTAGKQQIDDERNNLVYEYARMIVELQPRTFIFENVPGIVDFFDFDGVPVLEKFCLMLEEGGYGKWEKIKKSLLMQTNAAAVIKGNRGSTSVKRTARRKVTKKNDEQTSLFNEKQECSS